MQSLRRVDYLEKVSLEVIVNLAFVTQHEVREKGSVLYDMEVANEATQDEMLIVFDGVIDLYMVLDSGVEIMIEHLSSGSVLNPHNFLAKRRHSVMARCSQSTTFYYIKRDRMIEIAKRHSSFTDVLLEQLSKAESLKTRD